MYKFPIDTNVPFVYNLCGSQGEDSPAATDNIIQYGRMRVNSKQIRTYL